MPVDGAKCQMLVEGVLKEVFAEAADKKGALVYSKARVAEWTQTIQTRVCDKMSALEESDFKFIVTCTLMETNGAGFHTSSTGYWEAETDGAVSVKHQVSRALSAIVSVFWVESQTNNVPAPADHAIEAKEMKDLAEKNIVGVAGKLTGYDHNACKDSAKTLMDELTKSLVDLNRPFKYIVSCTFLQRYPTAANECGPFGSWDQATPQAEGEEPADLPLPKEGPFKVQGTAAGKGVRCVVTVHACYEGQYAELRPKPEPTEVEPEPEDAS